MTVEPNVILTATRYAVAIGVMACIVFAPTWLAEKNKKNAITILRVRAASWLFGWTIIGYFYGLYLATAKDVKPKA